MGDLRNGETPPDDGGEQSARDLPELPPEWRDIVIPDDLSGLDAEVQAVRRELRRSRSAIRIGDREPVALRIPLVIMVVAVLMALVSLFVMTWGRAPVSPLPTVSLTATATTGAPEHLTGLVLADTAGAPVVLDGLFPAAILLMDGCTCPHLPFELAGLAPAGLTVVAIGLPASLFTTTPPANVRLLADPSARLAARYATGPRGGATAIIVDHQGVVVSVVGNVRDAAAVGRITVA